MQVKRGRVLLLVFLLCVAVSEQSQADTPTLLSCYTLGCHSMRHIVGGVLDRFSSAPRRKVAYDCVSCLNRRHMMWAWLSLFSVALSDLYVRLCSMGVLTDWRIF